MFKVEWSLKRLFSMPLLNFIKVSFKVNSYLATPKNRIAKTLKKLIFIPKIFLRVELSILRGKELLQTDPILRGLRHSVFIHYNSFFNITNRPDFKGIETNHNHPLQHL